MQASSVPQFRTETPVATGGGAACVRADVRCILQLYPGALRMSGHLESYPTALYYQ